jgi:PKD repeat protein
MVRKGWVTLVLLVAILSSLVPAAMAQGPGGGLVTATEPIAEEAVPMDEVATVFGASTEAVSSLYLFSSSILTYTEITTGTVHGTPSNDDQSFNAIPLGFTFYYNGAFYTQVSIQSNGFIAMGPTVASSYTPISTGTTNNVIVALGRDIQGNGTTSELRSLTEGTAGNHVFTVQWKHYKRYGSSYVGDDFNFQIKLYEATSRVEVVYGPFTVVYAAAPPTVQVGLRGNSNADFNNRRTDATHFWANSLPGTANTDAMDLTNTIYPPNGLTYDWDLVALALDPPAQSKSACPGSDVVYNLEVINLTGMTQTFDLDYTSVWPASGPAATGPIPHLGSETITVTVHVPWAANAGDSDLLTITAADPTQTYTATATATTFASLASGWQDYANIPAGREVRAPSVVYYDGKLYVIGGYGYVSGSGAARPWLSIYDIATDSWSTGADMPGARYWIDCEQLFDPNDNNRPKIYCAGGYDTAARNTLYIYDIGNNSWTTGPTLPAARYHYASVKLDNKYYVIGGYSTTYEATVLVYDPATNAWSTVAPMNVARRYFHAGVIGGKIYVAGGYNGSYLSSAEVYDPTYNTWTYVASMPMPWVNGADGVKHDRFLVIAGGSPSSTAGASNGALVYDALTNTWNWLPLLDHLIYGAEGDTDGNGDFWYVTGRLYEGGNWLNSPYTTKLVQCQECVPAYGADFTVNPPVPRPGLPATFSGSVAGGSPPIAWTWDFGDNTTGSGQVVQHTYAVAGTYTVVMTATNCDGANWVTATHDVQVMSGPMIAVDPPALESTQCPGSLVTQTLSICNRGDQPLVFTITEVPTLLGGREAGIESLSGSFVVFDPSVGGDTCFTPGASQTFCFRAESFTNDWEYVYNLWQRFPADWTVNNVYVQGTPYCDSGSFGSFSWSFQTPPYEVNIAHSRYQDYTDHCVAYYCFEVTSGTGTPNALESWYWDGDGWGDPPHNPCSDDGYTPAGQNACDQATQPQASIPPCGGPGGIPWLSENPTSGTVPPGGCQDVTVTFDSSGLTPGAYTGTLRIDSNDTQTPVVNVPVELTVAGPPTNADFTWEPTPVLLNTPVTFHGTADALVPVDYTWDFGDNNYGSGQDPSHTYTTYGDFTVVMTATACGGSDVVTHTVTVLPCWSVVEEHFEGAFPPAGWSVINNGGNCVWQRNDQWSPARPNYAGGQGTCADADSDRCGSGTTMNTELRTMVLDLTGLTTATLQYVASFNYLGSTGEFANTDISTDGGATWTTLLHWVEDHSAYGPGEQVVLDLTPYAGQNNVMIRFHYNAPGWDWWWEVDQVKVFGCYAPGAVPDIEVTPLSLTQVLHPNETAEQSLTIANQNLGQLQWSADVGCGVPVGWLSMGPLSGTVPAYSSVETTVGFDSTGLDVGFYTADICIHSNDPDEPQVVIPVTLEVTGTPDIVVQPTSLFAEQCPDSVTTQTLSICNNGLALLQWSLSELSGTLSLTGWRPAERPTRYVAEAVADRVVPGEPAGPYGPLGATWSRPQAVLWDNGPLTTHPNGCGTTHASRLQTSLGMNTLGFGHQFAYGYRMSDDFEITDPAGWDIDTITFFAYQTGAPMSPSPITGVYLQIWDGPPWAGGSVVWGDLVTNRLLSSTFSGIQRDSETSPCPNNRYIFADVAQVGTHLPPGHYWLDWMTDGSASYTGPWAPPVTILGQTTTGDAYQYTGSWAPALDSGTGTQQGMPFIIEGSAGVPPVDVPWLSEEPISGTVVPGACQTVVVTFDSAGLAPGDYFAGLLIQSNDPDQPQLTVPVTMTVDAPASDADFSWLPVTPIAGEVVTFTATASGTEPLSYEWAFGDGTTGSGQIVTHTYAEAGDYTVVLTVSNACATVVATHVVHVAAACEPPAGADFSWSPIAPTVGETVTFTGTVASGTEPLSYEWAFGDGNFGSGQTVTHAYAEAGSYEVVLTVTNACGISTATHSIVVQPVGPTYFYIYLPIVFKGHQP